MNQKIFALGLGALLSAISFPAHAQKEAPIPRVGILKAGASPRNGSPDVFVLALRDLGYIENKNIVFDIRYADGDRGRLREFAKEMVQLKLDAIFTATSAAMFALKEATKTIPIVIVSSTDPVEAGLVASLARPGGNITGMSLIATDLWPKRLELLKEIFPQVSKIAMFWNKSNTGMAVEAKATREAAGPMGVAIHRLALGVLGSVAYCSRESEMPVDEARVARREQEMTFVRMFRESNEQSGPRHTLSSKWTPK